MHHVENLRISVSRRCEQPDDRQLEEDRLSSSSRGRNDDVCVGVVNLAVAGERQCERMERG
jgi:hypothetical protein